MKRKNNSGIIILLVVIIAILCGIIGYLIGVKEIDNKEPKKIETKETKKKDVSKVKEEDTFIIPNSFKELEEFFNQENEKEVVELSEDELKEYYEIEQREIGCSIYAYGYKYNNYTIIIPGEGCVGKSSIIMYKGQEKLLNIEEIYTTTIKKDDNSNTIRTVPFFKDGKIYFMKAYDEDEIMALESIDFNNNLKETKIKEYDLSHGYL